MRIKGSGLDKCGQMASTAFQNFDQKANQLYNLLSSVMKAMNEMRINTMRNIL